MTKAEERRVRASLERARVKLKERQLELETAERTLAREREDFRKERADALVLLRLLCEQRGLAFDWEDEVPLVEVIERLFPVQPVVPVPEASPRPLRPTPLPTIEHRLVVVPAQDRTRRGYGARCTCGWVSAVEATEEGALLAAGAHDARMAASRRA